MPDLYRTISGALFRAPNLEYNNRDHIPWNAVQERAAEKALEAEREKERQENALQHIQTLSEKTIKKLDEEISAKNMTLECTDDLIESRKNDMAEWEEKAEYSKSEYLKEDELLTDKNKEVEQTQGGAIQSDGGIG